MIYLDYYIFGLFVCFLVAIYMYFQNVIVLINLLLTICILRYVLLFDVITDICFVFTMYLINLADTNISYSGYCF